MSAEQTTNTGAPAESLPNPLDEVLPGGLTKSQFLALRASNPVASARYQVLHGISVSDPSRETDARRLTRAGRTRDPAEQAAIAAQALSWARR